MIKGVAKLPDTKNKGQDKMPRHGDSGVAGAMAWYATLQEGGMLIEYTEAPKSGAGWNGSQNDEDDDCTEAGGGAW
jgi:phage FluMu gp28-like protein